MDLFKMKAVAVGTVVGDGVDLKGNLMSGVIHHVDPDNDGENGRYSNPIVTADVRKKLEMGGFAKAVGRATMKDFHYPDPIDASVEAERVEEFAEQDAEERMPAALDTRNSVNFPHGDIVRGGVIGLASGSSDAGAESAVVPEQKAPAKPGRGRPPKAATPVAPEPEPSPAPDADAPPA